MLIADFKLEHVWKLVDVFSVSGPIYVENGIIKGNISGRVRGHISSCEFCGTPIVQHCVIQNELGQEKNVGNKCVIELTGSLKAREIIRAIDSAKNKAGREFERPIYARQLKTWFTDNIILFNNAQNILIDNLITTELAKGNDVFVERVKQMKPNNETWANDYITSRAKQSEKKMRDNWSLVLTRYKDFWSPWQMAKTFKEFLKSMNVDIKVPIGANLNKEEKWAKGLFQQKIIDDVVAKYKNIPLK